MPRPNRDNMSFKELTRLTGNFYVQLPFGQDYRKGEENIKWIRVNKQSLFAIIETNYLDEPWFDVEKIPNGYRIHGLVL